MAHEKSRASARIDVHEVYSRVSVISLAIVLNLLRITENVIGSMFSPASSEAESDFKASARATIFMGVSCVKCTGRSKTQNEIPERVDFQLLPLEHHDRRVFLFDHG